VLGNSLRIFGNGCRMILCGLLEPSCPAASNQLGRERIQPGGLLYRTLACLVEGDDRSLVLLHVMTSKNARGLESMTRAMLF